MKQTVFLILSLCIACYPAFSQKNRVEIYTGGYKMYNTPNYDRSIANMWGIGISRQISNKLTLQVKYHIPNIHLYKALYMSTGRTLSSDENIDSYNDTGKITARRDYHYFDAGLSYKIFSRKNHSVSASQLITLSMGKNDYLVTLSASKDYDNAFRILSTAYETKKEIYLGGTTGIRYDYIFWKNRLNIGADFAARYYLGNLPLQLNYGLHLGYNF